MTQRRPYLHSGRAQQPKASRLRDDVPTTRKFGGQGLISLGEWKSHLSDPVTVPPRRVIRRHELRISGFNSSMIIRSNKVYSSCNMSKFRRSHIRRWSSNQGIPGPSPRCCKLASPVPCRSQAEFRFASPGFLYFPIREWFNFLSREGGVLGVSVGCAVVTTSNDVSESVAGVGYRPCHSSP